MLKLLPVKWANCGKREVTASSFRMVRIPNIHLTKSTVIKPNNNNNYKRDDCLVGLVVRCPPRERKIPGLYPACDRIFSGSNHTSDPKIGTPVATLPGAWRYRVSTGTGRPGVSILWLGEIERWICNFYLSVAACKIVWADPTWDTLACCWDVKQPTNQQTKL